VENRAIISLAESDYWHSCHFASLGLRAAYKKAFLGKSTEFFLSKYSDYASVKKIAQDIISNKYSGVVFIDSSPLYGRLLSVLQEAGYVGGYRFHVFGDMVRRSSEWLSFLPYLEGRFVEWACASERQQRLVNSLLKPSGDHTWVCPFPIFQKDFVFSKSLRSAKRRKLKFRESDFVILYTGRMTLQKNVVALLRAFASLPPEIIKKSRLVFAGDFDDLAAPFAGMGTSAGSFYRLWQESLNALPKFVQSRVLVLPGASREDLRGIYSAADLFVSLSLQHDEDFGMAPVEASISGLPLILTSWGGYAHFHAAGPRVKMVPVSIREQGPSFELSEVTQAISDFFVGRSARTGRTLPQVKKFDVDAVSALLKRREELPTQGARFSGFDGKMEQLRDLYDPNANLVVFSEIGENSVYEQVYRNYCDQK
jgi:glycosyltransferase involved in cell wall biosynthesis